MLVALEGIDGSGTTTQLKLVSEHFRKRGHDVLETAEPSQGPVGILLRQFLKHEQNTTEQTLALLFAADRLDHLQREIHPHLAKGGLVLSDRYLLSSLAYQSTAMPLEWVQTINAQAQLPDLSIFFQVSVETALKRRKQRHQAEEYFDAFSRQTQIAERYQQLSQRSDVGNCMTIDAGQSIPTVTQTVIKILEQHLSKTRT